MLLLVPQHTQHRWVPKRSHAGARSLRALPLPLPAPRRCRRDAAAAPDDVVRAQAKLMLQEKGSLSVFGTLMDTYKAGGLDALFVGVAARVSWILPFTAFYLPVYDMTKRKLLEFKQGQQ